MGELFGMWRNTRMVVLTAICAALYAAILIPFKVVPVIPGVTEFRPANAVPVVCSFLFGPAAAWGAAFGNLIGDFFGGLGPGDFFGFFANLAYGLVPYLVWEAVTEREPMLDARASGTDLVALSTVGGGAAALAIIACLALAGVAPHAAALGVAGGMLVAGGAVLAVRRPPWLFEREVLAGTVALLAVVVLAATLCADVVGWGLQLLGFHPFTVLGTFVLVNNVVVAGVLGPFLLHALYPRVRRARLHYRDLLGPRPRPPRWRAAAGVTLATVGIVGTFVAGEAIAGHRWLAPWAPFPSASGALAVGLGLLPSLALAVGGLALL